MGPSVVFPTTEESLENALSSIEIVHNFFVHKIHKIISYRGKCSNYKHLNFVL